MNCQMWRGMVVSWDKTLFLPSVVMVVRGMGTERVRQRKARKFALTTAVRMRWRPCVGIGGLWAKEVLEITMSRHTSPRNSRRS